MLRLADVVDTHWRKQYKLKVLNAYLDRKHPDYNKIFRNRSLHLEGRAFDLELIATPPHRLKKRSLHKRSVNHRRVSRTFEREEKRKMGKKLPTLAGLAYYEAKFSFVEVKQRHIHVSCAKTGKNLLIFCFNILQIF